MNLRSLEIFVTVVECEQITRAASKLFISQPTVTLAIQELEKQYSVELFVRVNKKLILTAAGSELYARSKIALRQFGDIDKKLSDFASINILRIGATITIGNCMLANVLTSLDNVNKFVYEKIVVDNTQAIVTAINNGELDIGIVEGQVEDSRIAKEFVCDDELIFVVSPQALGTDTFIQRERGSGTRSLALLTMERKNLVFKHMWEMSSVDAIISAVLSARGATAISARLVQRELDSGELVKLVGEAVSRKFYLIHHKDRKIAPHIKEAIISGCQ